MNFFCKSKTLNEMRIQYKLFDDYCLRTPIFSYSKYVKTLLNISLDNTRFEEILKNPVFKEAVYLASPDLYFQMIKMENEEIRELKKIKRIQLSILKYFTRISTRCTPFGLFASCSMGEFDYQTNIELKNIEFFKRATRFDTTIAANFHNSLLKQNNIKEELCFFPNTSLYLLGDEYRYVQYFLEKKKRKYTLEGVKKSNYLDKIFSKSSNGSKINELVNFLVNEGYDSESARLFIEELIQNQLLVSELEINLTGFNYIEKLTSKLKKIEKENFLLKKINESLKELNIIDKYFGNNISDYKKISQKMDLEIDDKELFQTDCFTSCRSNTLSYKNKKDLQKSLRVLNSITLQSANRNIERFKRDFKKRYGDKEIPLSLALDIDSGVGYGDYNSFNSDELIHNLNNTVNNKRYEQISWTDVDQLLLKKISDFPNHYIIEINDDDLKNFPVIWGDLPDTISSVIEVYNHNNEEKIYLRNIGGSSAMNLMSRFSYGDNSILEFLEKINKVEKELNKDKVLAEIIHLPEARTGNILQRSILRDYEIVYLAHSDLDKKKQIRFDDLYVSIRGNNIVLKSKRLNKEILPKLSNAHNFKKGDLLVYLFLCDIQNQNKRGNLYFSWNEVLKTKTFLPRVEYENIIFSKARWNINCEKFKKVYNSDNKLKEIKKWQKKLNIPDLVELVEGDNKLFIDLSKEISLEMLYSSLRKNPSFILEEFLFNDQGIVKRGKNSFCNQFIVSFYKEKVKKSA